MPASYTTDSPSAWLTVWAPSPQPTDEDDMPPAPFTEPEVAFRNTTIRQTFRATAGGDYVRLRISNVFGSVPLHVTAATIALPQPSLTTGSLSGSSVIFPHTLRQVLFAGATIADIPGGSHIISDPLLFPLLSGQIVSVSLYLRDGQDSQHITSHPGSRSYSWLCHDDHTASTKLAGPQLQAVAHWYFLSGLEVWQQHPGRGTGTLVLLGDSITDGRCSTGDANNRWPDLLFDRMQTHPIAKHVAVANQAVGGGRVLRDGKGPSLMRRLDRDALVQPGLRYIFVFHGANDLGTVPLPDEDEDGVFAALTAVRNDLIGAYRQVVLQAHAHRVPVFGATIGPFGGHEDYGMSVLREQARKDLNKWIRTSNVFDVVVDFDAVLRCPHDESRLRAEFDSGDHLHPNVEAFQAMAAAFPLDLFDRYAGGFQVPLWENPPIPTFSNK